MGVGGVSTEIFHFWGVLTPPPHPEIVQLEISGLYTVESGNGKS